MTPADSPRPEMEREVAASFVARALEREQAEAEKFSRYLDTHWPHATPAMGLIEPGDD